MFSPAPDWVPAIPLGIDSNALGSNKMDDKETNVDHAANSRMILLSQSESRI